MALPGLEQNEGFDFDFVTTPPDDLCCAICLHVLRDPHQTDCGHHFCLSCITKAYQQNHACPVCKESYTFFRDKKVARDVKELRVRCYQSNQGCEWVGELGSYINNHVNQCDYVSVSCTQCQQLVPKRLITKHQDHLCPLRKFSCDYCRTYISTYDDVTKNHWPVCESFRVPCPNDCPKRSIPRSRLMEHISNECEMKKEAAEMKSQNAKLLEKLQYLQECLEKKTDESDENECRLKEQVAKAELEKSNLSEKVQSLEQELAESDEKIKKLEEQVASLQSRVEELQQSGDDKDGSDDHQGLATVSQWKVWSDSPQRDKMRGSRRRNTYQDVHPTKITTLKRKRVTEGFPALTSSSEVANLLQNPNVVLEWSVCQPLPENMVDGHAIVVDEFVYAGGGTNRDIVYKYHIKNNNWGALPKANRQKFAMVCYNSQLILIGGKSLRTDYHNSLLIWDEQAYKWTDDLYPPMNTPRMHPAALSNKEHIIVAGGKNGVSTSLDSVEVFDGSGWYYVAPLPVKIHSAKATLFENQLYLMGGNGQKRTVYCASLDSLTENLLSAWRYFSESDFPNATVVTFGNTLIAIGGSTAVGSTSTIRGYFTGTKTWLRLSNSLPRSLCAATAVVVSREELLVIGGRSGAISYKSVFKAMLKCSA